MTVTARRLHGGCTCHEGIRTLSGLPFYPEECKVRSGTLRSPSGREGQMGSGIQRKKPLRLFTIRALISWSLCPELNWRPHPYQG